MSIALVIAENEECFELSCMGLRFSSMSQIQSWYETAEHVLLECPCFVEQRLNMQEICGSVITLESTVKKMDIRGGHSVSFTVSRIVHELQRKWRSANPTLPRDPSSGHSGCRSPHCQQLLYEYLVSMLLTWRCWSTNYVLKFITNKYLLFDGACSTKELCLQIQSDPSKIVMQNLNISMREVDDLIHILCIESFLKSWQINFTMETEILYWFTEIPVTFLTSSNKYATNTSLCWI